MKYIRGWRQLKALFYLIEDLWIFIIGRDSRGLYEEEKRWVVYCGIDFMQNRLRCAKRELEIMTGFAKPYAVYTTPLFNEQYRNLFGDEALIELLYKFEKQNEEISEKK